MFLFKGHGHGHSHGHGHGHGHEHGHGHVHVQKVALWRFKLATALYKVFAVYVSIERLAKALALLILALSPFLQHIYIL